MKPRYSQLSLLVFVFHLTVPLKAQPAITQQPASTNFVAGQIGILTAAATGTGTPSYQWRRFGQPISGANTPTLTVNNVGLTDAGLYDVVVTDSLGSTVSQAAQVNVVPPSYAGIFRPKAGFAPRVENIGGANVILPLPGGGFYALGSFTRINGAASTGVARFLGSGALDPSFTTVPVIGPITAAVLQGDGKLVIGGIFGMVGGIGRNYIARLNADGTLDTAFNPGTGFYSQVMTLALQADGKIVVGGFFSNYNGTNHSCIARFLSDGTLDPAFNPGTGFNRGVLSVAVQSDGKILAGGFFTAFNGVAANHIARLNADGTLDTGFTANGGTGFDNTVNSVALDANNRIVAGGYFGSFNGTARSNLARLNGDGTLDTAFLPTNSGPNSSVNMVTLDPNGQILIGGYFGFYGSTSRLGFARINPVDGTLDPTFAPSGGPDSYVQALGALTDGRIVASGGFMTAYGVSHQGLAKFSSDGALDAGVTVAMRQPGSVNAILPVAGGRWIIGGNFTMVNDVSSSRLARLNADGSTDTSFAAGSGPNDTVFALVGQPDGKVLVGGQFYTYNGAAASRLTRLNADGTLDSAFTPGTGFNDTVFAVALQNDGRVVVGGVFSSFNGAPASRLARLNADGTVDSTFNSGAGFNNAVIAVRIQPDGKILAGGNFTTFNSGNSAGIARLNADGTRDTSFNVGSGFNDQVNNLALQLDGRIMASGWFYAYDGTTRQRIISLNANGTIDTAFAPPNNNAFNNGVFSLALQGDGKSVALGNFTGYGGAARANFARVNGNGALDTTFNTPTVLPCGEFPSANISMLYTAEGNLLAGGIRYYFTEGFYSGLVMLEPAPAPAISVQPVSQTANLGGNVIFSVTAAGENNTYQWFKDGHAISGATNPTALTSSLSLIGVAGADAGSYSVVVSNAYGTQTSTAVTLSGTASPPTITQQPVNTNFVAGQTGTLTVVATGTGTLSYQWRHFGQPIAGATASTLTVNNAALIDAGFYDVVVANDLTLAVSQAAQVNVIPPTYAGIFRPKAAFAPRFEYAGGTNVIVPLTGGGFYALGSFTRIDGVSSTGVARFLPSGALDSSFATVAITGAINSALLQSDGKLVIGGSFGMVGGVSRNYIARLNADGTLDTTFNPGSGFTSFVAALALQADGKIVVGGNFFSYNGTNRGDIARLNSNGTLDTAFSSGAGFNGQVTAVAVQADGKILASGWFTTYNGTTANRMARLNADGTLDTAFNANVGTGLNSPIISLAVEATGRIVAGGYFSSYNGTARNNLLRLNANGTLDTAFLPTNSGPNSTVNMVTLDASGRIVIGGWFGSYGGAPRVGFARLNPADGTLDATFATSGGPDGAVKSVAVLTDDKIVASGWFASAYGVSHQGLAKFAADGALDAGVTAALRQPGNVVTMLPVANGQWLVGGSFALVNDVPANNIVRLNANGSVDPSFAVGSGSNDTVFSLIRQPDGKIIVGGQFYTFNGVAANRIVRLNVDGTRDPSFTVGTGFNNAVFALALQNDGRVVAGGNFSSFNGTPASRIARLNPDGTLDPAFNPGTGFNSDVFTVRIQPDGRILVAGNFSTLNSGSSNFIARLNADGTRDTGFTVGTGFNNVVYTMEVQTDGRIMAGGWFSAYNGTTRQDIVSLNANGTLDSAFVPPNNSAFNSGVYSLVLQGDGRTAVLGTFTSYSGTARTYFARVNGNGTLDPAFNVPTALPGSVVEYAHNSILYTAEGNLLIGGSRYNFAEGVFSGLVMLEPAPVPAITVQPVPQIADVGVAVTLSVTATGENNTYQWFKDGQALVGATNATLSLVSITSADYGLYYVVVANAYGTQTSTVAKLRGLTEAPWVITQPQAQNVIIGQSFTLSVAASGDPAPTYQWRKNGVNIPGATGASYTKNNAVNGDGGSYDVVITNSVGSITSAEAMIGLPGLLWGVGANEYGALADGTDLAAISTVAGNVVKIAAGGSSNYYLKSDGTLWGMGYNASGQLGDGTTTNRSKPVQIAGGVSAMAAGSSHLLYLKTDGTLWGVGSNGGGQLGDGTTTNRTTPVQVAAGVSAIASGASHSLYLKTDSTLWAMGANSSGQLGIGATTPTFVATPVQVATGVSAVTAGSAHSLFVKTDGTLWVMGANSSGQLGDTTTTLRSSPVQVATGVSAVATTQSSNHSFYLKTDGTLMGMGSNSSGQLGDGTKVNRSTPVVVAAGVSAMTAGGDFTLYAKADGTLWSMGGNVYGQLGDGTRTDRVIPAQVATGVTAVSGGNACGMYLETGGTLRSFGYNWVGQRGDGSIWFYADPVLATDQVSSVAAGSYASGMYLKADQTLWTLGDNLNGQLGNGTLTPSSLPAQVAAGVVAIAAGGSHNLYLKTDGSVWAMGANSSGQFGNGTTANSLTPIQVATGVKAIAASSHSLFLKTDGTLLGAGLNNFGQLGDGTTTSRSTPVTIATGVTAMAAGSRMSLFLKEDGSMWGMGTNSEGQMGLGTTSGSLVPIQLASGVNAISTNGRYSLFLKADGTLWAMGLNSSGRLGDGTTTLRTTPVLVASGVGKISAGAGSISMFIKIDGTVWWMGGAGGTIGNLLTPVQIAGGATDLASASGAYFVQQAGYGTAPAITVQPAGGSYAIGYPMTLSVAATGSGPIDYQWRKGGVAIPGARSATYYVHYPQASASGSYDVVVTNSAGSVTSSTTAVTLAPGVAPAITTAPLSQTVTVGATVTFTVVASGTPTPTYQWKKDGTPIPDATNATLTLSNINTTAAGSYTVTATNVLGSVDTAAATLAVNLSSQTISFDALPAKTYGDAPFALTATASSGLTVSYASSNPAVATVSGNTLTVVGAGTAIITASQPGDASYLAATSVSQTLIVNASPVITIQPLSQTVTAGATATLTVVATGTPVPTYQWRMDGTNISSATNSSLTLTNVQAGNAGSYDVVVSNSVGSVTSSAVLLLLDVRPLAPGNLVGWWPGDGTANAIVGANGVLQNGTTFSTGKVGQAFLLDGVDDRVEVGATGVSSPSKPFTLTAWIKPDAASLTGGWHAIVMNGGFSAPNLGYYHSALVVNPDGAGGGRITLQVGASQQWGEVKTTPSVLSPGQWAFVVATCDGTRTWAGMSLYVNGALQTTVDTGSFNPNVSVSAYDNWRIGSSGGVAADPTYFFSGLIDEVQIFSRALTLAEIQSIYSSASAGMYKPGTALAIAQQPQAQTATAGANVNFSIAVVSTPAPAFQWQESADSGSTWSNLTNGEAYSGANLATLTVNTSASLNSRQYRCVLSNAAGSVPSTAATLTVNSAPAITTQPANATVTIGQTATFHVVATGNPAPSYQWRKGSTAITGATSATLTLSSVQAGDAGSYAVMVSNAVGSVDSAAVTLTVNRLSQTITFGTLPAKTYGDAPFALTATASSGLTVSYSSSNTNVATVSGTTLTVVAAGTATITASQIGDVNYLAATDVTQTLTVAKATPVVTWAAPAAISYGTALSATQLNATANVPGSFIYSPAAGIVPNAGSQTLGVTFTPTNTANYNSVPATQTLTVNQAAQTITFAALPAKTYGDASFALAATASSGLTVSYASSNPGVATVSGTTLTIVGGGTATITASQAGNGNYTAAADVTQTLTVAKATQTITFAALPTKTYGDAPFALAAAASSGLTVSYASSNTNVATVSGTTLTVVGAGTATITASQAGDSNYLAATSVPQTLTVNAPPVITTQPLSRAVTVRQIVSFWVVATGTPAPSYQWQFNGSDIPGANASSYAVNPVLPGNAGSYTVVVTNSAGSITSNAAALTVSAPALGTVMAWGYNKYGQTTVPAGLEGVMAIAAGSLHTVALKSDGTVVAWGDNRSGPTNVPAGLSGVTAIAGGGKHTVALKGDGTVVAWGDNSQGQATVPAGLSGVTAIAAGLAHTMALRSDGTLVAWGDNSAGQATVPAGLSGVTAIAAGDLHTLALKSDGTVVAWGDNSQGQTNVPIGLGSVTAIAAGGSHTVALQSDGTVMAWGYNLFGQTTVPAGLGGVTAIAAGGGHTVALMGPRDYSGTYFGVFASGGNWALYVRADHTATFIAYVPSRNSAIVTNLTVGADGSFTVTGTEILPLTGAVAGLALGSPEDPIRKVAVDGGFTLTGQISVNGTVTGQFTGVASASISGAVDPATGPASALAGYYSASALGANSGATYAVVGASGQAVVVTTTPTSIGGATGTVNASGQLTATTSSNAQLSVTLNAATDAVSASVTPAGSSTPITFSGLQDTVTPNGYLANLSVRAAMTAGQTLIVGFVVDGGAKPVLIRAAGPVLNKFGLTGVADPQLNLYNGGTKVAGNDNWEAALASTFATLGAFPFDSASKDAALLQSINGPHTAQATATGAGAILVEAYDAGPNDGRKLVNLSARFQVGTGDNILIAGFVLSGTGTRQVLIRAVGPTLASYGVPGTLVDPQLAVYDGGTVIASNDNWSSSLSSTFTVVGAFALNAGSRDAAIVVTLQAGKPYTVQVSGVGSTTGEALVEVYAMP